MIRSIVPFRYWHLKWLEGEGLAQGGWAPLDEGQKKALEQHNSWTGVVDNEPIGCGGTVQIWPGRHSAWAYLVEESGPHMRFVTRAAKRCLSFAKGRIEMTAEVGFDAGERWAKMLGFERECYFRRYGPDGKDHIGFVRFN